MLNLLSFCMNKMLFEIKDAGKLFKDLADISYKFSIQYTIFNIKEIQ